MGCLPGFEYGAQKKSEKGVWCPQEKRHESLIVGVMKTLETQRAPTRKRAGKVRAPSVLLLRLLQLEALLGRHDEIEESSGGALNEKTTSLLCTFYCSRVIELVGRSDNILG